MSDIKPTLVVLAAGMGSRYGGLKQIDPVGPSGEFVMDYSVYDAVQAGFGKVLFLIRKDIEEDFREVIEPRYAGRIPVEFAFQELDALPDGWRLPEGRSKPWGTAHAVLCCKEHIHEPFAVINADDFYGRNSFQVLADWLGARADSQGHYCLVGFKLANTLSDHGGVSRGVCQVDAENRLCTVVETHNLRMENEQLLYDDPGELSNITPDASVSMNMWGFTPDFFEALESDFIDFLERLSDPLKGEAYIPTTVDRMIKSGEAICEVLPTAEQWQGVTYPEDKPSVTAAMQALVDEGKYPSPLWS